MFNPLHRRRVLAWACAAMVCAAAPAGAQVFTGRIDVTTQDQSGAVLTGVTIDL